MREAGAGDDDGQGEADRHAVAEGAVGQPAAVRLGGADHAHEEGDPNGDVLDDGGNRQVQVRLQGRGVDIEEEPERQEDPDAVAVCL